MPTAARRGPILILMTRSGTTGEELSLDRDIYPHYDLILCVSTLLGDRALTAKCKVRVSWRNHARDERNHPRSGLAVDYNEVSADAERIRLAMTGADKVEIDFGLEDGRLLEASLELGGQEAQKSHGLCKGRTPDIANLPAGEVYFVPQDASGQFPMKYEDGTLGILDVVNRDVVKASLIEGSEATIAAHNRRLADDPMTGTLGELGFGTQVLPVSYQDIQDEKVLGTCHLATGRDDHLGGDIVPDMFKKHSDFTTTFFLLPQDLNFNLKQVRMKRAGKWHLIIEDFRPSSTSWKPKGQVMGMKRYEEVNFGVFLKRNATVGS